MSLAQQRSPLLAPSGPDRVTDKLAAPRPPDSFFDKNRAARGEQLFSGKAKCATCHEPPLYTEPGHQLHSAEEIGIDDFQASRSPEGK